MNVRDALRLRYPAPEWCLLFEVRNGTGYSGRVRTADAIAIGTYPSRGMPIIGFEFKASRNDWMNELKDPSKADEIAQYCDNWYLVVTDKKIVMPGELPVNWGLLAPFGEERLKCMVEAKKLEDSKPLSRRFFASLVRNMMKPESLDVRLQQEVNRVREDERKRYDDQHERFKTSVTYEHDELKKKLAEFEAASGITIGRHTWQCGKIGAAVKMVMNGELDQITAQILQMHKSLTHLIEENKLTEKKDG